MCGEWIISPPHQPRAKQKYKKKRKLKQSVDDFSMCAECEPIFSINSPACVFFSSLLLWCEKSYQKNQIQIRCRKTWDTQMHGTGHRAIYSFPNHDSLASEWKKKWDKFITLFASLTSQDVLFWSLCAVAWFPHSLIWFGLVCVRCGVQQSFVIHAFNHSTWTSWKTVEQLVTVNCAGACIHRNCISKMWTVNKWI